MKERIWRILHADPQEPPELVLSRCRYDSVHCWSSGPGAVKIALYLQHASHDGQPIDDADSASARFAYRSFHPEPIRFTRSVRVEGGQVDRHDPEKAFELPAGRTTNQRYRTARLPDAIGVTRGPNGAQVTADIELGQADAHDSFHAEASLSVSFPEGGPPKCPCCS
jgi:hypothetical protein